MNIANAFEIVILVTAECFFRNQRHLVRPSEKTTSQKQHVTPKIYTTTQLDTDLVITVFCLLTFKLQNLGKVIYSLVLSGRICNSHLVFFAQVLLCFDPRIHGYLYPKRKWKRKDIGYKLLGIRIYDVKDTFLAPSRRQ